MPRARAIEAVRQARADVYRSLVLEAAEELFAEHGFEATRMQQVAEAAGLSVGTLYGLVAGKAELYAEVQRERGAELLASVGPMIERVDADDPVELLITGVRAYVRFLVAHPSYLKMQLREVAAWASGPSPATTEQYETWNQGQLLTTRIFERAVREGRVVDEDPRLLARTMIAMQQVHLAHWVEGGMRDDPERLIDGIVRQLRRSFLVDRNATPPAGAEER